MPESKKRAKQEEKVVKKPIKTSEEYNPRARFRFTAYLNEVPIKPVTIKNPGIKGLQKFILEDINVLSSKKNILVVAKIDNNLLDVNPTEPEERISNGISAWGYLMGIVVALNKMKIKVAMPISIYEYANGKFNKAVSKILNRKVTIVGNKISKIDGMSLEDSLHIINSSKIVPIEAKKITNEYNTYIRKFGTMLVQKTNKLTYENI